MKINQSLGILGPSLIRRKGKNSKRPPWFVEVPPDTVDIALLPRINRYERGGIRFRSLGSTQQKLADRLSVFRDAMGELEPGLAHSESEMREGLEAVMYERLRLLEEAELKSQRLYGSESDQLNATTSSATSSNEALAHHIEAHHNTQDLDDNQVQVVDLNGENQDLSALANEVEEPMQGIPTDWLVRRLEAMK
jgi:hypothetical protein